MSTFAVTPDAPAVSEREPSSHLMPTDKNYRLTGQLPDELEVGGTQIDKGEHIPAVLREEEERKKAVKDGASATPESDTAAASEAAPPQEKGPERTKSEQTSESRWAKITRENRELRERLARLEGAESARQPQREAKQEPRPAAEAASKEPKIDDKDDKGQFKYKTIDEYYSALTDYRTDQKLAKYREETAKEQRERAQAQAKEAIQKEVTERVAKARKTYPDYDAVTSEAIARKNEHGQDVIYIPEGSAVDVFILDSPKGHDVLYELCKNSDQYAHIFAHDAQGKFVMNPVRQLRELAKIENSLDAPKAAETPAKPITQAPRPPHQVSGKGTVAKDAVERAVEENDSEAYIREQNARAIARRKGK
jgi:hypothetical protein